MKARPRLLKTLALAVAMLSVAPVAVHAQTTTTSPYIPELQPRCEEQLLYLLTCQHRC